MVRKPYTTNTSPEAVDWRNRAACAEADPEIFFPIQSSDVEAIQRAKRVCGACAVNTTCLQYALETGQDYGIWGGLTDDERRALKRRIFRANYANR